MTADSLSTWHLAGQKFFSRAKPVKRGVFRGKIGARDTPSAKIFAATAETLFDSNASIRTIDAAGDIQQSVWRGLRRHLHSSLTLML
ncbi:MAG TPA: hypothetical protein VF306_12865 [Pirellulales bacterium]